MPRGDGTGPAGLGPMTGRAAGFCAGYAAPGYANPIGGRGYWGRGGGFGRGWGRHFAWPRAYYDWPMYGGYPDDYAAPAPNAPTPKQELTALREQANYLRQSLDAINKRIGDLEQAEPT